MSAFLGLLAGLTLAMQADAEDLYARDFQGEFAPMGACAKPTELWVFTPRDVTEGKIACEIFRVSMRGGHVLVATRNCSKAGAVIPDRHYNLDLMSEDVVKARVAETTALLKRCPTR